MTSDTTNVLHNLIDMMKDTVGFNVEVSIW